MTQWVFCNPPLVRAFYRDEFLILFYFDKTPTLHGLGRNKGGWGKFREEEFKKVNSEEEVNLRARLNWMKPIAVASAMGTGPSHAQQRRRNPGQLHTVLLPLSKYSISKFPAFAASMTLEYKRLQALHWMEWTYHLPEPLRLFLRTNNSHRYCPHG